MFSVCVLLKSFSGQVFEAFSSDEKLAESCALMIRREIMSNLSNSSKAWPPNLVDLAKAENQPPGILSHFLSFLIGGKQNKRLSRRQDTIVRSLGQDICYNTTSGQWKTAKHVSLAISLHHTTGSAKLVTLLSRYGHCCSYSFVLEAEAALCISAI